MRKLFTSLFAIMLAAVMLVFTGCNLVVVNDEKDMNQVVATVKISDTAPEDKIYKRDLAMAYLTYGYQLEQQGQSRESVINALVAQLIETRVFVQNAVDCFSKGEGAFEGLIEDPTETNVWNLDRYLTDSEKIEAEYQTKLAFSSLIDSYEEVENEKVRDTLDQTLRDVPTGATNAEEEELSDTEKQEYKVDTDSTSKRRVAFNKAIKLLENNHLLGNYVNDISKTEYYQKTLEGQKEQAIIRKYQKCLMDEIHAEFDFADVEGLFSEKLEAQMKWTDKKFAENLSSASAVSPILYAPTGTYGFVYNLLLGASEDQQARIKAIREENPNISDVDYAIEREKILKETIVKDLRSSWILSGYDFDGTKFTGDYALAGENSLEFKGDVKHLNADEVGQEDYKAEYNVQDVTEFTMAEFISMMEEYVYGETKTTTDASAAVERVFDSAVAESDYEDRINELLFAFSTDPGSLNTYKGYLVSPAPDAANNETYVQEFADGARQLLEKGNKSYVIVATDYGYHVMFYSQKYEIAQPVYASLTDYLNKECADLLEDGQSWAEYFANMQENWSEFEETDNYLYVLYAELVNNKLSAALYKDENATFGNYIYGENSKVTRYPETYADWIK